MHIDFGLKEIILSVFSGFALLSALIVVLTKQPIRAVLMLVFCFINMAVVWMFMEAEFLSLALIFVYVGAVMTLFIFVVMMLNINVNAERSKWLRFIPAIVAFFAVIALLLWQGWSHSPVAHLTPAVHSASFSNVAWLGKVLYTEHFLSFELAAVILLTAMIAAIALAFRGSRKRKSQDVDHQVAVTKDSRLRIVDMEND